MAVPVDKYWLVFSILLIHGLGTLTPWNMFINADSYFREYKLGPLNATAAPTTNTTATSAVERDISETDLDNLRKNFLSYLGFAAQVPNLFFNGLNLLVDIGSGNLRLRVNLTLALEAIIFALTIILAIVDSSQWPYAFFCLTMISVVILNMASGIYQNCIFGTGAKFPGHYTNAILIGSNLSGTFTSTVNLLSIWLAPKPQEAAIYYFVTALVVILICLVSYNLLILNPFFRHHDEHDYHNRGDGLEIETMITSINESSKTGDGDSIALQRTEIPENLRKTVDAMVPRPSVRQGSSAMSKLRKKWLILRKCWPQCVNVCFTFYITLALFPAVMADIRPKQNYLSEKYFTPFACFFIFNVFAMIGNLISGMTTWPGKERVWMIVFIRALFIPFFLFCNFHPTTRHWSVLIERDMAFILGNVLLALSSGYLSSLCMIFASDGLDKDEAPTAGMLAAFFLVLGIFLGINSSFILTWVVELG